MCIKKLIRRPGSILHLQKVDLFILCLLRTARSSQGYNHPITTITMVSGIRGHMYCLKEILLIFGISAIKKGLCVLLS